MPIISLFLSLNPVNVRLEGTNVVGIQGYWQFYVLIALALFFAWIKLFYTKNLRDAFKVCVNMRYAEHQLRDDQGSTKRFNFSIATFFLVLTSLIISQALDYLSIEFFATGFNSFLAILFGLIVFYLIRFLIILTAGYLFKMQKLARYYTIYLFATTVLISLIAFLLFSLNLWQEPVIQAFAFWTIVLVYGAGILIKYVGSFLFANQNLKIPSFYLFVYLCTLEILPWALLLKLLN
ncbi:MAG: hypothetical protein ACJAZ3_000452 [Sphingobacteriales bacterium]|jgi:hypothetical protein